MCGIVGYLDLQGRALPDSLGMRTLSSMLGTIYHRGPDEEGSLIEGPVALGMRRLSIIDLAGGQQPIANEDGSIKIVFNGEIYNYQELQDKLRASGHTLRTGSDTETIVHLYEDYGVDCLQYLEGMFAFAIWDSRKQILFIARDRMGEKPLYWHQTANEKHLIFSSELKGLLAHPYSRRELDPFSLRQYLALEYVPAPRSMLAGINKLMPGHYLIASDGRIETARYWKLPQADRSLEKISEAEALDELERLLRDSIRTRLISEVPLGVFLSGGIDSSIITAIASQMVPHKLKTFSVGFEDPSFDESAHARKVAESLGCEHTVIPFRPELARQTYEKVWDYLDEPFADASIIPTYVLSKVTRESVTVALSGDGGDELFGGYPTYLAHRLAAKWNLIPSVLRHKLINPLINKLPVSLNNLSFDFKLKRFAGSSDYAPIKRHICWMGAMPLALQKNLLSEEILHAAHSIKDITSEEQLLYHLDLSEIAMDDPSLSIEDRVMRLDMRSYLADDLLVKADRATMATSLEARIPFLAHPLVEFAVRLPHHLKYKGKTSKYLLRRLASRYLPEDITRRPKKGFGIPVAKWLKEDFKPLIDELLDPEMISRQGIFKPATVSALIEDHEQGRFDRRKELFTLLSFQMWWRRYLSDSRGCASPCEAESNKRKPVETRL